jgi:hypothetical protein
MCALALISPVSGSTAETSISYRSNGFRVPPRQPAALLLIEESRVKSAQAVSAVGNNPFTPHLDHASILQ